MLKVAATDKDKSSLPPSATESKDVLRIQAVSDYPCKVALVKIKDSATLKEFVAEAASALGLSEKRAPEYEWHLAAYLSAPHLLYGQSMEEKPRDEAMKTSLAKLGVKDGVSLIGRAPAALRPVLRLPTKKKKEEEKKEEKVSADEAIYKEFNIKNIFTKLITYKDNKTKKKRALEWVEMNTRKVMKSAGWKTATKEVIGEILKCDGLNAPELFILDALLTWGKAEAKRQKLEILDDSKTDSSEEDTSSKKKKSKDDDNDEEEKVDIKVDFLPKVMREVLGDLLNHIRFPTLCVTDIAGCISTTGLLEQTQLLALFTHIGQRAAAKKGSEHKVPLDSSLKCFSAQVRVPRESVGSWKFDTTQKGTYHALSNSDKTVKQTSGNSRWCTTRCTRWIKSGVCKVKFRIDSLSTSNAWMFLGVVSKTYNRYTDTSNGQLGQDNSAGWTPGGSTTSSAYCQPNYTYYGKPYKTGDIVEMTIDKNQNTLFYKLISSGVTTDYTKAPINLSAWAEVTPAVTTYEQGDQVTLM
eukprot:TRINITY_DN567_c0_g1_i1.p1 TRINITY_DN567_c0_g1~~TRINITY_DN567_c0_g1_i1.p1  ORF type:complete len:525 (-),score=130.20 TRINITY_DN567_c0_g1_i1:129-1703(-)